MFPINRKHTYTLKLGLLIENLFVLIALNPRALTKPSAFHFLSLIELLAMAMHILNLECRMYEAKYLEVDMAVMIQVKNITDMGVYVSLLEYSNIEGMILFLKLSCCRIRSVSSLIKVGRIKPVMVFWVDKEKGYIDLSKRRVSEGDIQACEESYNKSKLIHSIMCHVAKTMGNDLEV
jgi:translation initiation factor 2 subunit 1